MASADEAASILTPPIPHRAVQKACYLGLVHRPLLGLSLTRLLSGTPLLLPINYR